MLSSTPRKTGRPIGFHRDRHGTRHDGIMRLKDGRWRASGSEKFTFTEPDEDLALARFYQWKASTQKAVVHIPRAAAKLNDPDAIRAAVATFPKPKEDLRRLR